MPRSCGTSRLCATSLALLLAAGLLATVPAVGGCRAQTTGPEVHEGPALTSGNPTVRRGIAAEMTRWEGRSCLATSAP